MDATTITSIELQPTAADYLRGMEGQIWTAFDTAWVLEHLRRVDELAIKLAERARSR